MELTAYKYNYKNLTYPDGNIDLRLEYAEAVEEQNIKDWVAIYRKGESTQWKNVLVWKWVKDLSGIAPMDYNGHMLPRQNLPAGTYVARFFRNNSYIVDKSLEFTIKKSDSFLEKIHIFYYDDKKRLSVVVSGINSIFKPNPKDWMAIYKVGSSNEWKNVIRWTWTKDMINKHGWKVDNLNLPKGKYEVRYFLNNSYNVYKKSEYFSVVTDNSMARLDDLTLEYKKNQTININFYDTMANKKDWIAIFKKGAKKEKKNILAWRYNDSGRKSDTFYLYVGGKMYTDLKPGEYESVLFLNDSYTVIATAKLVIVNNEPVKLVVREGFADSKNIGVNIKYHPNTTKKDWVAIFKADKPHTRENILAWKYTYEKDFLKFKGFRDNKKYTAVLFKNDTYNELNAVDFQIAK